jgi:serine/threonine protein kinase
MGEMEIHETKPQYKRRSVHTKLTSSTLSSSNSKVSAKKVGSDYVLINNVIGRGSFSNVYEGYRKRDNMPVAIKAIARKKLSGNKGEANLEREANVMKSINHANIVRLYDIHKGERHYYLVMERCFGPDLASYLKEKKRLPEYIVHKFLIDLAYGLKVLNSINMIHRDLKPANLMLSSRPTGNEIGLLKIADFGFAREIQPDNLAETLCGSPMYMAPEVIECKKYDGKSDLWSVGVIMYELLYGRPPYVAMNMADLLRLIKTKSPEFSEEFVSPFAVQFMKSLLQHDPVKRISFSEFFDHPYLNLKGQQDYIERSIALSNATRNNLMQSIENNKQLISLRKNTENKSGSDSDSSLTSQETFHSASKPDRNKNKIAEEHTFTKVWQHKTLDKLVQIADGRIVYPTTIFDFSNIETDTLTLVNEIEQIALRAWTIAEAAYLLQLSNKFAESIALYSKSLDLLYAQLDRIYKTLLGKIQANNRLQAIYSWIETQFDDFVQKVQIIQGQIAEDKMRDVVHAEQMIYRYGLKLVKESTQSEYLTISSSSVSSSNICLQANQISNSTQNEYKELCISMYQRAKFIFEYLHEHSECITDERDQKFLGEMIEKLGTRIYRLRGK